MKIQLLKPKLRNSEKLKPKLRNSEKRNTERLCLFLLSAFCFPLSLSAATNNIASLPAISAVDPNDRLVVDHWSGTAFATRQIAVSNAAWVTTTVTNGLATISYVQTATTALAITNALATTPVPLATSAAALTATNWGGISNAATGGTAMTILANENVGIGTNAPLTKLTVVETGTSSPRGILSMQVDSSTNGARVGFSKSRGTITAPTIVQTGDTLGRLIFRGYDGTTFLEVGSLEVVASGNVAGNRIPTFMSFSTAVNASGSALTERMRILPGGEVGIGTITPQARLEVYNANIGPILSPTNAGTAQPNLVARLTNNRGTGLDFGMTYGGASYGSWIQSVATGNLANSLGLYLNPVGGNVGIATTNPATTLDVAGVITGTGLNITNAIGTYGTPALASYPPALTIAQNGTATVLTLTNYAATFSGTVTATNYALSAVKWVDCVSHIYWATGAGLANSVTNSISIADVGDGTYGIMFTQTNGSERLPFCAEAPHSIATTNATVTEASLFSEAHMHIRSLTNCPAGLTNAYFWIIWKGCNGKAGNNSAPLTNLVSVSLGSASLDVLIESGHLSYTNGFHPSISSTFSGTWIRTNGANAYTGPIVVKAPSVHVPVGLPNAIGSATGTTP